MSSSGSGDSAEIADAIRLQDVTFTYPGGRKVLDIPRLSIGAGARVFLHGPSGCGKSTLLSLIAGVMRVSAGEIQVLGHDFATMSQGARDRVRGVRMGYIFQSFNLIPYLSVRQNIALPCALHKARLRHIRASSLPQEVERFAQRLDIRDHLDEPIGRLSVGQQQRVAIARALVGSPSLLIADEPTSSLDANRRDEFIALLLELMQDAQEQGSPTTLVYVSHDAGLAKHFAQHLSLPALNRVSTGRVQGAERDDAAA